MGNRAAAIRNQIAQQHPGATVSRRGRRFIEHALPDGTKLWTGTIDYLHYGPQADQEIDEAWRPATAPDAWRFDQGFYIATARSTFNVGQIVTYIDKETGESVSFQPQQLQWSNDLDQIQAIANPLAVVAVPNDNRLMWPAAFGLGFDMEWVVYGDKLSKRLTIPSLAALPAPNAAILAGGNPYLRFQFIFQRSSNVRLYVNNVEWQQAPNSTVESINPIEFRSVVDGRVLWTFNPAQAFDENHRFSELKTVLRRQGSNLFVQVRLPWPALQQAAFPVVIDPDTLTLQPDATAGQDHYISSSSTTWAGGGATDNLRSGEKDTNTDDERTLIKFDLSSIPSTATIIDATHTVYMYKVGTNYADHDADSELHRIRAGRDWVEGEATWSKYKTSNSWSTNGCDNTTTDREATVLATVAFFLADQVNDPKTANLDPALVQEWVDATLVNNGWLWKGKDSSNDQYSFWSSDHTVSTLRPKLVVNYSTGYTLDADAGAFSLTGQTTGLLASRTIGAAQGAFTVTGQDSLLLAARTITASQGAYTLSGQSTDLAAARSITASPGAFTLSGQVTGLAAARLIAASQGAFDLTGQDAALLRGYALAAATAAYALTGQAAGVTATRILTAAQGAYTLTGQDAALLRGYALAAATAAYALTGQAAGLTAARVIAAAQGAFDLTGQDAALLRGYALAAATAGYALTGQAAGLTAARIIAASQGAYTLTGQPAPLVIARVLVMDPGVYELTGIDALLVYSGTTYSLAGEAGSFALLGQDAALLRGYPLAAAAGSFALSGQTAQLLAARILAAQVGSHVLTGQSAGLLAGRLLTAGAGAYVQAGEAAQFLLSYVLAAFCGVYTLTGRSVVFTYSEAESDKADIAVTLSLVNSVSTQDAGSQVGSDDAAAYGITSSDESRG